MEDLVGSTLGRFRITALVGRGGMATVYKATHPGLDQTVAIKVLHEQLAADPDIRGRFRREATAVAALRHPNIVRVIDFDEIDGRYFMVMEYIDGQTLAERLKTLADQGVRMSLADALALFEPLCSAVDYANRHGMVHRDIKPANILLTAEGEPVITDYGIARIVGATRQTATGAVLGSAHYMSPEQAQGLTIDGRTDVYSLGVVLYECLSGKPPFGGDSLATILMQHITAPVPPIWPLYPDLPPLVDGMLHTALAKSPDERFQTAKALATALAQIPGARQGGRASAAAGAGAVGVAMPGAGPRAEAARAAGGVSGEQPPAVAPTADASSVAAEPPKPEVVAEGVAPAAVEPLGAAATTVEPSGTAAATTVEPPAASPAVVERASVGGAGAARDGAGEGGPGVGGIGPGGGSGGGPGSGPPGPSAGPPGGGPGEAGAAGGGQNWAARWGWKKLAAVAGGAVAVIAAAVVAVVLLTGGPDTDRSKGSAGNGSTATGGAAAMRKSPSPSTTSPSPSPTSHEDQIACVVNNRSIWLYNVEDGSRERLTQSTSTDYTQLGPAWSPDGRTLAYVDYEGVTNDMGCRLWTMDMETKAAAPLLPDGVLGDAESIYALTAAPAWSPDGERIAFINIMGSQTADQNTSKALFVYDVTTQEATQVLRFPQNRLIEGLAWSADGTEILFTIDNIPVAGGEGNAKLVSELRSVNVRTGEVQVGVTAPSGRVLVGVGISPDGETIAFTLTPYTGGYARLLVGPAAGGESQEVVRAAERDTGFGALSWAPDGRRIAYDVVTGEGQSVWIAGPEAGDNSRFVGGGSQPAWRP